MVFLETLLRPPIEMETQGSATFWMGTHRAPSRFGPTAYYAANLDLALRLGFPWTMQDRATKAAAGKSGAEVVCDRDS